MHCSWRWGKSSGFWRSPHYSSYSTYCTVHCSDCTVPHLHHLEHSRCLELQSQPTTRAPHKTPPLLPGIATYIFPSTAPPQNPSCQSFRHIVGYCIHTSHDCLAVCSTSLRLQWKLAGRGIVQVVITSHKLALLSCLPVALVLIEADKDGFPWTIVLDNISMTGAAAF
ncbi:hypothetical protein BO99DRAFT_159479 [Aspergillus violaceofuscus CBS 115571]|uniref:Uncharacterized protein n=1 Tax=Aspergillus violaceofuscus (strain CBS 115571) TaxID=1450538 RepID=A0A2V5H909_ASPV1|nr:hypothetical protein BO99DRAFT_159479 [Aspergillus violaceofuscus CBS 115571]